MLQRRQIPWKAVGLTAAIVRCALTPSSRRKAPRREDQGGGGGGAPKRQEACGTKSRQEQHQAKEETGASRANKQRAAYPVEKASKAPPVSGQSNGCRTCHTGGFSVLCRAEPCAASFRLDDKGGADALTLPVPLKTLLEDQEAWEKYLRKYGAGEKSEAKGPEGKANPPGGKPEGNKEGKDKDKQNERDGDKGEKPGEGGGGSASRPKGNTTLKYGPVCCSCSKNGVHEIAHTDPVSTSTFITRPIRPNSGTGIGLCLMPMSRGTIQLKEGPARGHTPCPSCTVVKQGRTMCKCCANRIEAHGDGVGGAGPLPPLQMTDGEDARSNSADSRAGMTRDKRE